MLEQEGERQNINYYTHVIHLAAAISVSESMSNPEKYERINYHGSQHLLDWIHGYNNHVSTTTTTSNPPTTIRRVVAASSAAIYGDPNPTLLPLQESAPYGGLSPYADTKYRMEGLMRDFVTRQNEEKLWSLSTTSSSSSAAAPRPTTTTTTTSAVALRFFNVYGPRQDPKNPYSGVISLFLDMAVTGRDITILGDGEMTRDFVYVKDVARAIVLALLQENNEHDEVNNTDTEEGVEDERKSGDEATFNVYNVCTGKSITINTLAERVRQSMKSTSTIKHLDPREGDIRESSCNPTGAEDGIGFRSAVSQESGLEKTAAWFRLEQQQLSSLE
jgi:UDP-glucose 4-epimerase